MDSTSTCSTPSDTSASASQPPTGGWSALLQVHLQQRDGRTVLAHNRHQGPLRVQKLLQPGPHAPAQLLLVHPPGGIAGGDELQLDLRIDGPARALVTTPGATRWYRSSGATALQQVRLQIGSSATLEWLPQDNIVQDHALAHSTLHIDLEGDAALLGWDVLQLGQPLVGRPFQQGQWLQDLQLRRDGRLLLAERCLYTPQLLQQAAPQQLAGHTVVGSLWANGGKLGQDPEPVLAACRDLLQHGSDVVAGVSWLEAPTACLCLRALAHDAQLLRDRLLQIWALLRPLVIGHPASIPRIWKT